MIEDAETALLGSMLLWPDAIAEATHIVSSEDFYVGSNAKLFSDIMENYEAGLYVDLVTMGAKGYDRMWLRDLTADVTTIESVGAYAHAVSDAAVIRRIKEAGLGLQSREGMDADELIHYAQSTVDAATRRRQAPELADMGTELTNLLTRIEAGEGITGYPSGHRILDEMLSGFHPGRVYTVAADPGVGKSAFCTELSINIARQGHRVLIASLEMDRAEVTSRILAQATAIPWSRLNSNRATMSDWQAISEKSDSVASLPITIIDSPDVTVADLASHARALARDGLGLVVLDYIQLMSSQNSENRNAEIESMTRNLKRMSKQLKVPVVMASQLNRAKGDPTSRPSLNRLRDSGAVGQDSDCVIFLHPNDRDLGNGRTQIEVIVGKNRHGPKGTISFAFTPSTTTFEEVAL